MPFVTINQGAGADIPDGVYPVTLVDISEPKIVTAQRGPKAGEEITLYDWTFAIDEGDYDGTEITTSTSKASGPKSKMYSYITALLGGKAPAIGSSFEKNDLKGRRALATVRKDEGGWPRIENLGAMPAAMLQRGFAKQTGTPVTEPVSQAPLREQVAATKSDLPF